MLNIPQQEDALRRISNIVKHFQVSDAVIRPHFILTGPTGSGKSYLVEQVAKQHKMQFMQINAAQLTREGISGNSLSKAFMPLRSMDTSPTVVFVDEFDKLLSTHGSADESRLGVQDEFLKLLESDYMSVFGDYGKYVQVRADNLLFVFAGVFGDQGKPGKHVDQTQLAELGLRAEFLGRVGLTINLEAVPLSVLLDLVPKCNLLKQYLQLHPTMRPQTAVRAIQQAMTNDAQRAASGFRMINSFVHRHFAEIPVK